MAYMERGNHSAALEQADVAIRHLRKSLLSALKTTFS